MKVLLIGVGYVGSVLAGRLACSGHDVWGLRRSHDELPPGVRGVRGDAREAETYLQLPSDFAQVVIGVSPDARSAEAYASTYQGAVVRTRAALPSARIILISSTAVYAEDSGEEVTDQTTARPDTAPGAALLQAERQLEGGPHLVVRASGIYGPERTALLTRLLRASLTAPERQRWTNRIHQCDLTRVLHHCVETPDIQGTLLASDPEPARLGVMADWLRERFPTGRLSEPTGKTLASRPGKSRRIVASRLAQLGFDFEVPSFREGYAKLLGASRS